MRLTVNEKGVRMLVPRTGKPDRIDPLEHINYLMVLGELRLKAYFGMAVQLTLLSYCLPLKLHLTCYNESVLCRMEIELSPSVAY